MMIALADINVNVTKILAYSEGDDDEEAAEEEGPAPDA